MEWFTPRLHGAIDYAIGAGLIALPFAFEIDPGEIADWLMVGVGLAIIVFTAVTKHDLALMPRVPLAWHLVVDFLLGGVLIFAPWIFGFNERVVMPYIVFGFVILWLGLLTSVPQQRAEKSS